MANEHRFISAEPFDGDLYTSSQTRNAPLTRRWMNLDVVLITGRTA